MVTGQQATDKPPRSWANRRLERPRRFLVLIIVLSVILRVGVALYLGDTVPPAKDEMSYSVLAERLASGHGYSFPTPWYPFAEADAPTSHWSFLYTAFVAAVYAVAGPHPLAARLVQAVAVGVLMPWVTWRLAGRVRKEEGKRKKEDRIPLIAAALSAGVCLFCVVWGDGADGGVLYLCAGLVAGERVGGGRADGRGKKERGRFFGRPGAWGELWGEFGGRHPLEAVDFALGGGDVWLAGD